MNATEQYLKRATRGLWGARRLQVRQELESHLFERTRQLMLMGLSEADAQRTVLRELGAPDAVSRGMAGVYTLSALTPALTLTLLLGGAGLIANRAFAQVRVPVPVLNRQDGTNPTAVYISLRALRAAFAKAGVRMTGPDDRPTLSAAGLKTITLRLGQTGPGRYDAYATGQLYPGFDFARQVGQPYVDAASLATLAAEQGWPVRVRGWSAPTLTIGPAVLELRGEHSAEHLYTLEATNRVFGGACTSRTITLKGTSVISEGYGGIPGYGTHTLPRSPARPGAVYALALPFRSDAAVSWTFNTFYVAVAQAGPNGRLVFKLPEAAQHLKFVTRLDDTTGDFPRLKAGTPTYQDPAVRGQAILFPLNGTLGGDVSCQQTPSPLSFTGTSDRQ